MATTRAILTKDFLAAGFGLGLLSEMLSGTVWMEDRWLRNLRHVRSYHTPLLSKISIKNQSSTKSLSTPDPICDKGDEIINSVSYHWARSELE
jgi:hypothetical protein